MSKLVLVLVLLIPTQANGQEPQKASGFIDSAKRAYEALFTKSFRLSLEPIAPTSGIVLGIGYKPKPWRTASIFTIPQARAALSQNKYWAVDGSVGFQGVGAHEWRLEPYGRLRSMKRLNDFGVGNDSLVAGQSDFALLERRVGVYGYRRPAGWLAIGARGEGLWLRASSGESLDVPSVEIVLPSKQIAGFGERTNYVYVGAFVDLNYPYVRSERPRRGGDYIMSLGSFRDVAGTNHSFTRLELEGQERFPVIGVERALTIHGRLSSSWADSGDTVPFYLMDTLGGADNLRGFKEDIVGGDETTSTLRSFESFRFRDNTTLFFQIDLRQRLWSQVFVSVFADAGWVSSSLGTLSNKRVHRGMGLGVSVYRSNALAIRFELSLWGGEGHPHFITPGRGLQF